MLEYEAELRASLKEIETILSTYEHAWHQCRDSQARRELNQARRLARIMLPPAFPWEYLLEDVCETSRDGHIVHRVSSCLTNDIELIERLPRIMTMPAGSAMSTADIVKDRHALCNSFLNVLEALDGMKNSNTCVYKLETATQADYDNMVMRIKIMDVDE